MTPMILVHQVCELNKTTFGDVAFEKINNLTFDQVMEIIKSKDRSKFPVAWDLQDYLELQELKVCCVDVTTPSKNLWDAFEWSDKAFLGKITRVGDTYITENGYRCIYINGIERLYYKEESNAKIEPKAKSEPKYITWEELKLNKPINVKLNDAVGVAVLMAFPSTYGSELVYEIELCLKNIYNKDFIMRFRKEESNIFNNLHLERIK